MHERPQILLTTLSKTVSEHFPFAEIIRPPRDQLQSSNYHDDQVFGGRSQRFQRLWLVRRSLVVKRGPPDVKLSGPVDGPGSVDVIFLPSRF